MKAPSEKDVMKFAVEVGKLGFSSTETHVDIPREEAIKLVKTEGKQVVAVFKKC